MKTATLAVILAALIPAITIAQPAPREKVTQGIEWFSWTNNFKVHKRLTILTEGQFRFAGQFEPMQFQFRTAGEVHLTKNLSVVPLAYVYTWNPTYGKQPNAYVNNEHRTWQQVLFKQQVGRVHFSHRGRLEQRHVEVHVDQNGEVINEGYDYFANRIRYRFGMSVPLGKKDIGPKAWFANFYEEVFMSWGKAVTYHKPDQNRVFAGVGYQANKKFIVTTGFLYQMLVKANGAKQENNLGVQVNFTYNLDLTRD